MYENDRFIDLINIVSLIIGMQNLQENREQSEHNDVQAANAEQAKYLLSELAKQFEVQNKILSEQTSMLQEILKHLKGTEHEKRSINTSAETGDL